MKSLTANEIIGSILAHGGELTPVGDHLHYRGPALTDELRDLIRQYKPALLAYLDDDPQNDRTVCRGCAAVIPSGTTLCSSCGSKHSPLIRYALELSAVSEERTLRGRALVALDRRNYPQLELPDGRTVGPGLLAWCPVLREMDATGFRHILKIAKRTQSSKAGEDQQ